MTSQAQANTALDGVRGLIFLGFPLHTPDVPALTRAEHLSAVTVPMLFVQGERDRLALHDWIAPVVSGLGPQSTLVTIAHAGPGFDVLVRSGRKHGEVLTEILDVMASWIRDRARP